MEDPDAQTVVIVTGPSGAGRSTATHALEDIGFEAIDNLPLGLVRHLFGHHQDRTGPIVIGIDARTRGFSAAAMLEMLGWMRRKSWISLTLLYLECRDDVLLRRYSETRRRHPMAEDGSPSEGIRRERSTLDILKDSAEMLIDTSDLSPHDLKAEIVARFSGDQAAGLSVSVESFSYKKGVPQGLDMVLDCRFLRNPHWDPELRGCTGKDAPVGAFIAEDARFQPFMDQISALLTLLLPAYQAEGKAHFSLGFGCTGGRHRSVHIAEKIAAQLRDEKFTVSVRHRALVSQI